MESYDWRSSLKVNFVALKIMGLWPKEETFKFGFYVLQTFILFSAFIPCHIFFQVVNLYFIRDNLSAFVGITYILLIKVLTAFKGYYLIKNMRLLKHILRILNKEMFQPKNMDQRNIIKRNVNFWKIIQRLFVSTSYGSNALFAMYPLLDHNSEERRLPFLAWYPFNSKISPFYELTYTYQVLAVVYNTSLHINVDSLVCAFNTYASTQFDLLRENLKNLFDEEESSLTENNEKLVQCILHHKLILEYVKKCNEFGKWIVFYQFFVSTLVIGITMYQLTLVVPLSSQFNSLIIYWTALTVQIFHYCYFGNDVQEKSSDVSYAVFESNWTHLPQNIKKTLIYFTLNLMQPVRMSALDLFYLTLDTFVSIMKTSWSYFAFLHTLGSRK